MNIILTYICNHIPSHIEHCLRQTRFFNPDTPIYFIKHPACLSPEYFQDLGIRVCDIDTKKYDDNYIANQIGYPHNPLWATSYLRLYYIRDLMEQEQLTNCFHYDCDVMVYNPLKMVAEHINSLYQDSFFITRGTYLDLVFGMAYIQSVEPLREILNCMDVIISDPAAFISHYNLPMMNEMMALHLAKINGCNIHLLSSNPINSLPDAIDYNNPRIPFFFDPAGYGQWLDGSPQNNNQPGHIDPKQHVGRLMQLQSRWKIQMLEVEDEPLARKTKRPVLLDSLKGIGYKINSLHIHSKNTHKYISY